MAGSTASDERAPPRKRRRLVISCTECHRRKQKCDRELPCANCRSRNKADNCTYDDSAPTAKEQRVKQQKHHHQQQHHLQHAVSAGGESGISPAKSDEASSSNKSPMENTTISSMATDWGYGQTGPSTIGFLKRIESADEGAEMAADPSIMGGGGIRDAFVIGEKYKCLIRQLPARPLVQKLSELYFKHFNWHYAFLEEVMFFEQLAEWNALPFGALSSPFNLPIELRTFPGLLFQVLATALLVLGEEDGDEDGGVFEGLKYAGNMSWEDLAGEYSQNGVEVLRLFEKRHLALATVQAQFVRTAYMKYTAQVAESWHVLAGAIRDAQELGMHRDSSDPKPRDQSLEAILENQWVIQVRRKLYMVLAVWDISCSVILGRPLLTDWSRPLPTRPLEVEVPPNWRKTPLVPRNPSKDPPNLLTRLNWLADLSLIFRETQILEQDGPYPKDFSKVDKLHAKILQMGEAMPPYFRLENPDTQWDSPKRMLWLKDARGYFCQLYNFSLLALHRPYIFHRKVSRDTALLACLRTLDCHQSIFRHLPKVCWRNYMLFFGSFDAIVVVSSIFILFPQEQIELRESALQHFRWTIERFETMQNHNALARSAVGVLKAILSKFVKAIDGARATSSVPSTLPPSTASLNSGSSAMATPVSTNTVAPLTVATTPSGSSVGSRIGLDLNSLTPASSIAPPLDMNSTPSNHSITNMGYPMIPPMDTSTNDFGFMGTDGLPSVPLLPTSDLVWSDLNVLGMDGTAPESFGNGMSLDPSMMDWQFGGGFGDDTVWQFLNQYQPGQV